MNLFSKVNTFDSVQNTFINVVNYSMFQNTESKHGHKVRFSIQLNPTNFNIGRTWRRKGTTKCEYVVDIILNYE